MTKKQYPKLPKTFKTKWLKALRSDKFKQGKSNLYDERTDSYCCLGVACRISRNGKDKLNQEEFITSRKITRVPKVLRDEPCVDNELTALLAKRNDSGKWPFKRLADWIEKNL